MLVDSVLRLVLVEAKPVDRLSTRLLTVLSPVDVLVDRPATLLLVVLRPVEAVVDSVLRLELVVLSQAEMPSMLLLTVLRLVEVLVDSVLRPVLVVLSQAEMPSTLLLTVLKPVDSEWNCAPLMASVLVAVTAPAEMPVRVLVPDGLLRSSVPWMLTLPLSLIHI